MERPTRYHEIQGEEKERYLKQLDHALSVLSDNLMKDKSADQLKILRDFGEENEWQWDRLPEQSTSYQSLSKLIDKVRQQYNLFDNYVAEDSTQNRGWFENVKVSSECGMLGPFDMMELRRLRRDYESLLEEIPTYEACSRELRRIITTDYLEIKNVEEKVEELHKKSMQRSFLEQLGQEKIIGWEDLDFIQGAEAERVITMGGESLWNIAKATYSKAEGMFHIYIVDLWQDDLKPEILDNEISEGLNRHINRFGADNAAWYIIKSIDESFESLHPVHATRMLVGPFEGKYLTQPSITSLPVTSELLKEDPEAGLLRASIQYSFAPNHRVYEEKIKQILHREDWRDEVIVCPGQYSAKVSSSVLGTKVRIMES